MYVQMYFCSLALSLSYFFLAYDPSFFAVASAEKSNNHTIIPETIELTRF